MKKELTPIEKYKKRSKWSKNLRWIAPVCFWVCIALSIMCLVIAIKNSVGNVAEITRLLDSRKYTGEQLETNYEYLVGKYGEWLIGNGGAGFSLTFVNIGHALFSKMAVFNLVMSVIFFASAFVLGKWTLPKISKSLEQDNQDMVNMTILEEKDNK